MSPYLRIRLTAHLALVVLISSALLPTFAMAQPAEAPAEASAPAPTPPPLAESLTGAAREHYNAAVILFQDGDAAGALLKFRAAYDASQDPRLLWNMAVCEKQLRHYAKMLPLIERYLEQGGHLMTEAERAEAQTVLQTLRPFVGRVTFQVSENGAAVYVDDELIGQSPLPPQRVDMGERRLRVTKAGFDDWTSTVRVQGGEAVSVVAQLRPERKVGGLRVTTEAAGEIRIDGNLVGRGYWQGELPAGTHTVDVRAPGMQPYQSDVVVETGQTNALRASLRPVPKPTVQREEGGVPVWIWIAGGALATAGLGLGAYALFKPGEPGDAPPIAGTMNPGSIELP